MPRNTNTGNARGRRDEKRERNAADSGNLTCVSIGAAAAEIGNLTCCAVGCGAVCLFVCRDGVGMQGLFVCRDGVGMQGPEGVLAHHHVTKKNTARHE
jgi:hypothetical protein